MAYKWVNSTKAVTNDPKGSTMLGGLLGLCLLARQSLAAMTVIINGTASHAMPTTLYGQMFEDINHSGDGGLYAELLQNRAFQLVDPSNQTAALYAWHAVGGAQLTVVDNTTPVSSALPNSLQVVIPEGTTGTVGFGNEGYFGINVNSSWTYNASFYYYFPNSTSTTPLNATLSLVSASTDETFGSTSTQLTPSSSWSQVNLTLTPSSSASDTANNFTITFDGAEVAGQTANFAMLSLFPPTFKGRENGMRIDIAEALYEMRPAFFRLPGGNNLEGESIITRWIWNDTIGSLVDRPGRVGDWGYINTDGLGFLEYLYWCEDMEMQPIMAVYAGYSLDGSSVPEDDLQPYIQAAIDQINFVIGDPATSDAAALRARLGREEPFDLTYVEVGNEDFFSATYTYRWPAFVGNLSAAFPGLKFIATSYPFDPIVDPMPGQYDVHVYQTPSWFKDNAFYYDSFERNGTSYFEGEYAAISTNANNLYGTPADGRLLYPTIEGAVGEAAFMTGLERNADIVFAASYAPLLQNIASTQWTPDLVSFDAGTVYRSTSFYVQKLFSLNRGDEYLPSTLPTPNGTVFWSVTRNTTSSEVAIKVANYADDSSELVFQLPYTTVASTATVTVLAGGQNASNTPDSSDLLVPTTSEVQVNGSTVAYEALGWSVSVIVVEAS